MNKNVWQRRVNDYVVARILPRGHPQLHWSDVITKDLKDLNIRKELTDEQVEWQRQLWQEKYNCKEYNPSEMDKHYK